MLHPQVRAAQQRAAGQTPVHRPDHDLAAARAESRRTAALEPREDVASVADVELGGVPCRRYDPDGSQTPRAATILHVHGGGFVLNDVDVHDAAARRLANRAGMRVVSVDYRRPPEHRFPAAVEDVDAVLEALGDGPVLLHGDSAGANLALVCALHHPGRVSALALIYPFLDPRGDHPSYRMEQVAGAEQVMAWFWEQYAARDADLDHPDLAPLLSPALATLPPTLVTTAEHDPLRDEGEELVARLAEAGVRVVGVRSLGQTHGFWRHPQDFDAAEPLTGQVAAFLRQHAPARDAR